MEFSEIKMLLRAHITVYKATIIMWKALTTKLRAIQTELLAKTILSKEVKMELLERQMVF